MSTRRQNLSKTQGTALKTSKTRSNGRWCLDNEGHQPLCRALDRIKVCLNLQQVIVPCREMQVILQVLVLGSGNRVIPLLRMISWSKTNPPEAVTSEGRQCQAKPSENLLLTIRGLIFQTPPKQLGFKVHKWGNPSQSKTLLKRATDKIAA